MNASQTVLFGGILIALAFGGFKLVKADSLADLSSSLRMKFPNVRTIRTAELNAWLDDGKRQPPLLIDAREKDEFAVSHLPGAYRAESDPVAQLHQLGATINTSIVLYCSVGYRSSLLARKLQDAGFTNVSNLEGSIFAWANEARPLMNEHGFTTIAHPFNLICGRYLDRSHWHWKPDFSTNR